MHLFGAGIGGSDMPIRVDINTKSYEEMVQNQLRERMEAAMDHAAAKCKKRLSRSNAGGASPSKAGESPKKVTGQLIRSIKSGVEVKKGVVHGYLSADTPYALRLEFGFVGTDSAGRHVKQAPRPYLRPTLSEEGKQIANILIGKKI